MHIHAYVAAGYTGHVVAVEVDIRRGIPGTDIVGLAGSAVREARERVRVAVRRSGLHYPRDRVVVNLSPAGVPKSGAGLDLAIAIAILASAGQIAAVEPVPVLVLGELRLDGRVRAVSGVLAAVSEAALLGISRYIIPAANSGEAAALGSGTLLPVRSLVQAVRAMRSGVPEAGVGVPRGRAVEPPQTGRSTDGGLDYSYFAGAPLIVRAMEIAAAGRHNLLLVGPPGSGKTVAARTLPSILAPLVDREAVEATRIHSLAGTLAPGTGLLRDAPFRAPHHTSSTEGMTGGGIIPRPGEISLAHNGVLFLDEALQFRRPVLQSLREPLESNRINLARATGNYWFPADFQLLLATNPCPCGNLGRRNRHCLCSQTEVQRYWRVLSGPMLDRIELRVSTASHRTALAGSRDGEASTAIRERVIAAVERQRTRYHGLAFSRNGRLPSQRILEMVRPAAEAQTALETATRALELSSRAQYAVLRVARTIADLSGADRIDKYHLLEAVQYRRLGEGDSIPAEGLLAMPATGTT
ncbi:MAG: ATP-binding protein [Spirochaetaceae bacterium]|nr:MAG: ATP-binding protein [Spirochaetaceae bacterium]